MRFVLLCFAWGCEERSFVEECVWFSGSGVYPDYSMARLLEDEATRRGLRYDIVATCGLKTGERFESK